MTYLPVMTKLPSPKGYDAVIPVEQSGTYRVPHFFPSLQVNPSEKVRLATGSVGHAPPRQDVVTGRGACPAGQRVTPLFWALLPPRVHG